MSFEDILGELNRNAGNGGPVPGAGAGGGRTAGRGATQGRPANTMRPVIEAPADVSLEEAFHGTQRLLEIEGKRYEVQLPRGVDTGSRIKLSGKGPDGSDVVVAVKVRPHDLHAPGRGPGA